MRIWPFLSVVEVLICSKTGETYNLDRCSAILMSDSDLLKDWRVTHNLDHGCSAVLVSDSDLLRWTHNLDGCSDVLVSSDLLKDWVTHKLDGCSAHRPILISGSNQLKEGRVTHILDHASGVQPFSSVVLITQMLESDSRAGWMFSHSYQWFQSA